jgi:Arc/MetJ-type ribon-helix-helix transcriptional regulator
MKRPKAMVALTVKVSPEKADMIYYVVEREYESVSAFIRRAVNYLLEHEHRDLLEKYVPRM